MTDQELDDSKSNMQSSFESSGGCFCFSMSSSGSSSSSEQLHNFTSCSDGLVIRIPGPQVSFRTSFIYFRLTTGDPDTWIYDGNYGEWPYNACAERSSGRLLHRWWWLRCNRQWTNDHQNGGWEAICQNAIPWCWKGPSRQDWDGYWRVWHFEQDSYVN